MVDEKSGFLPFQPVNVKFQTPFGCDVSAIVADEVFIGRVELGFIGEGRFRLVEYAFQRFSHDFLQSLCQKVSGVVHTRRMCLHDGCFIVDVDNESRQVIAFSVHEPVGVVVAFFDESYAVTYVIGGAQTGFIEFEVDIFFLKSQNSYRDAAYLVMSEGDKLASVVADLYNISLFGLSRHALYGAGENPRVKSAQRFVLAGF